MRSCSVLSHVMGVQIHRTSLQANALISRRFSGRLHCRISFCNRFFVSWLLDTTFIYFKIEIFRLFFTELPKVSIISEEI